MTALDRLFAEGRAQGKAQAVLDVLEHRQLPIPAPVREQVLATRDEQRLRGLLARVLTVASAEELVAGAET